MIDARVWPCLPGGRETARRWHAAEPLRFLERALVCRISVGLFGGLQQTLYCILFLNAWVLVPLVTHFLGPLLLWLPAMR